MNVDLTLRNWLIGFHISEYELNGADRAEYGERLLDRLASRYRLGEPSDNVVRLSKPKTLEWAHLDVGSCQKRRPYTYLRIYQTFPETMRSLTAQSWPESMSYTHIEQLIWLESSEKLDFHRICSQTEVAIGSESRATMSFGFPSRKRKPAYGTIGRFVSPSAGFRRGRS